jgi:hypothetical protein
VWKNLCKVVPLRGKSGESFSIVWNKNALFFHGVELLTLIFPQRGKPAKRLPQQSNPDAAMAVFVGREWLRNETFPPRKTGRSTTVPALQSHQILNPEP